MTALDEGYDRPFQHENVYDDGTLPQRIVKILHSRWLRRGLPFEPMPPWVNAIRQRAKHRPSVPFTITYADLVRLATEHPGHFGRHVTGEGVAIWVTWISDWGCTVDG